MGQVHTECSLEKRTQLDLNPDGTLITGAPDDETQWVYVYDETGTLTLTENPVPEPATLGLVSAGLLGLLALRRRKT